ncbi:MAG: hypothetical protein H6549_11230 [Chitinophagales bacterium]|nr:hypothetical protein [Chitinophagales bacterium]
MRINSKLYFGVLCLVFITFSCKQEVGRISVQRLLSKIERYEIGYPENSFVTYYNYDVQERVKEITTYIIDSTLIPLDSVLYQKSMYNYSGNFTEPYYIEIDYRDLGTLSPGLYQTVGIELSYNAQGQLVHDSIYTIAANPTLPYVTYTVCDFSYSGNVISKFGKTYQNGLLESTQVDTSLINIGGNLVNRKQLHNTPSFTSKYSSIFEFDNSFNPVKVPFTEYFGIDYDYHLNSNNVTYHLWGSGLDSVLTTSQYQYDSDGNPLIQFQNKNWFFPVSLIKNYVFKYTYY